MGRTCQFAKNSSVPISLIRALPCQFIPTNLYYTLGEAFVANHILDLKAPGWDLMVFVNDLSREFNNHPDLKAVTCDSQKRVR